jgi:hypothetical protein
VISAPVGSLASEDMQSSLEKQAEFFRETVRPLHEAIDSLQRLDANYWGFSGASGSSIG